MDHIQNSLRPTERRKRSRLKRASGAVAGAAFVCLVVLLVFPDPVVNGFVRPGISRAIVEAYPAYSVHIGDMHVSVFRNRFGCDSLALSAHDGTWSSRVGPFSVSGLAWIHLLWGGTLEFEDFAGLKLDARDIRVNFPPSRYELLCRRLRVSVPDSEVAAEALEVRPSTDDELLFAGSAFRMTRFRIDVPHAAASGIACLGLLQGRGYRTRSVLLQDAFLDVLTNKDRPDAGDTSRPPMPHEILPAIPGILRIDSLSVVGARLRYGERFAAGAKPALITFDSLQVLATRIANREEGGTATTIRAGGRFMKAGTMNVLLVIPVAAPDLSFEYSGSLNMMDLRALNAFLETAEQIRITGGFLQTATFVITVSSGRAGGNIRAVYRDLTLAVLDERTRSSKGFSDGIASFLANTFTIRGTNAPDRSGRIRLGEVDYVRRHDDPFFRFLWFALRSGVGDVAGF